MSRSCAARSGIQGLALIAVLWIVAALSIIAMGMLHAVRAEVRVISSARQAVVAGALGDAAINLVIQELLSTPARTLRLASVEKTFEGVGISVQVLPLTGLIDINAAPKSLLESLFLVAGRITPQDAAALAQAAVDARSTRDDRGRAQGFEATEDLLRVPGFDYALYASISPLITADVQGGGRVNPVAAPIGVLIVLADGNVDLANRVATERDAGKVGVDTSSLNRTHVDDNASSQRFRMQARVPLADGALMISTQVVDLVNRPQSNLPWRVFRSEHRLKALNHASN
jgi:general secretion pathway protein K